jgi:hypothetical protein
MCKEEKPLDTKPKGTKPGEGPINKGDDRVPYTLQTTKIIKKAEK